jgi:hypothetical protein
MWVVKMEIMNNRIKKWGKGNEKLSSKITGSFIPVVNKATRYEDM